MTTFSVYKRNDYNPQKGLFYVDKNGTPTKEHLGDLLFTTDSWLDACAHSCQYDFPTETIEKEN
jgi:hypothetical protein